MSKDYIFEPRPTFSAYTPNLFLGSYYIEDGFQADPSMWADPLEDAFVTNAGMKEGQTDTTTYLNDFSAETILMGTKKLDELEVLPQSYFWKWVNYDGQLQIPTEMSEDDFESPAYERFMEAAVGYDSDNPYFLLVVDSFMDDGDDVDIWAEEADWNRMQTTELWWKLYDLWMEAEGVDFLTTLAEENYDWAVANSYELQQIGYDIPPPDDDDYYWSMRQAENEGSWSTFGQVDYNWATDPDDVELADVEFSEIDEYIRNEIRWEIDANNIPGEGDIDWAADREDGIHEEFTISYYWGPVQTTGVNSAEGFEAEGTGGSFVINNNRGFSIGFDNGYALSVKFGPGTYSDNYAMSIYGNVAKARDTATEYIESSTAEIAVLKDGALMSFDEATPTNQIMGWVPTSLIPSILTAVSEGDDRKIRSIAKKHFDRDQAGDESYSYGAESFEAPYAGVGSLMGIKGDTDLSSFTPDELTKSSAIHGDFDTASLDYSGHQNIEVRAEDVWDDSDYYDPQDAWERSFETWMEEWVTGGATRTDILRIYAAKNGIVWSQVDEVDVADAAAWYEGLTIAEREDEIFTTTDENPSVHGSALGNALDEIIADQMDSWDDQFQ
jgi:hypothetical protein